MHQHYETQYEVGLPFMECTVDVVYDPADITELTIEYEGHAVRTTASYRVGQHRTRL
ncbi:hypothetical protein [Paenibacillus sp. J2TS4]|uniref:hypothetical protein n=1 Tax=Paenibacillus sp. J2TS4 TaxID=2807194 RepID=UPI0020BD51EE|nr:hypothetical protein [Paenibacillus sp. J2TS4]